MFTNEYLTKGRTKYYLKAHIIFVCKYRKELLKDGIEKVVKDTLLDIAENSEFSIEVMECDINHIHMLISYPPHISVTSIVRKLKQESTIRMWKNYQDTLKKHFWKEHTFWSDGYFACSIGEASPETVIQYIKNQG